MHDCHRKTLESIQVKIAQQKHSRLREQGDLTSEALSHNQSLSAASHFGGRDQIQDFPSTSLESYDQQPRSNQNYNSTAESIEEFQGHPTSSEGALTLHQPSERQLPAFNGSNRSPITTITARKPDSFT